MLVLVSAKCKINSSEMSHWVENHDQLSMPKLIGISEKRLKVTIGNSNFYRVCLWMPEIDWPTFDGSMHYFDIFMRYGNKSEFGNWIENRKLTSSIVLNLPCIKACLDSED